jgi:O-antigen/teichoic acid export membrane protein
VTEPAPERSIWARVWRDFLILGAGNVGVVILQLCFRAILIVQLVPASYGRLALLLTVYNTIWIFANSGLPNSIARYIAINPPGNDTLVLRAAIRAAAIPMIVVGLVMACIAGALLNSPLAGLFGAVGVSSLVYSQLGTGVLRGRHRVSHAATVMPVAGLAELVLLVALLVSGLQVTEVSAFGAFSLGNVIGLAFATILVIRTTPRARPDAAAAGVKTPTSRQLLGFSLWLAGAAAGIAALPLIMRLAAALDSYTQAAIVDLALVIFNIPQRAGAIVAMAVVPHASRAATTGSIGFRISRRQQALAIVPFLFLAVVFAATPAIEWLADAIGRPEYEQSAKYAALVMLAGPARVLYGLTAGILIGQGRARFLCLTVLTVLLAASAVIVVSASQGQTMVAFAVFVAAIWTLYLVTLSRVQRLSAADQPRKQDAERGALPPRLAEQES